MTVCTKSPALPAENMNDSRSSSFRPLMSFVAVPTGRDVRERARTREAGLVLVLVLDGDDHRGRARDLANRGGGSTHTSSFRRDPVSSSSPQSRLRAAPAALPRLVYHASIPAPVGMSSSQWSQRDFRLPLRR